MGCYIGLTHTITHHLHLTEAKTETIPLDCIYVYVCARKKGREQKLAGIRSMLVCVCVQVIALEVERWARWGKKQTLLDN